MWAKTSVSDKLADAAYGEVDAYRSEHVDDFIGKVCGATADLERGVT
jgi:hypothetical protein